MLTDPIPPSPSPRTEPGDADPGPGDDLGDDVFAVRATLTGPARAGRWTAQVCGGYAELAELRGTGPDPAAAAAALAGSVRDRLPGLSEQQRNGRAPEQISAVCVHAMTIRQHRSATTGEPGGASTGCLTVPYRTQHHPGGHRAVVDPTAGPLAGLTATAPTPVTAETALARAVDTALDRGALPGRVIGWLRMQHTVSYLVPCRGHHEARS